MSGPYLIRLNSNDGTKYNLLSWTMFCVGTAFFLFFVTCGSLITPVQRIPHILACFIISGAALVLAVYAVFKLVTFHRIRMSRSRPSNDNERTVDSDPVEAPHTRLLSKTDPLPIDRKSNTHDSIHPSRSPKFSPPRRQSPTDSLLGLVSGESLRSRSWLYLASEATCRFRRSFSYDSSVSATSMTPYAYGTFQLPDSTRDSTVVNETSSSTSLVEHPVYAVPNKGASRNDLGTRSRSGLVEDSNYHLPLDCVSSSSRLDATRIGSRSCLENTDCYSPLNDSSYASPPQALSSKNQSQKQQGKRSGLVKDSGHNNPLSSVYAQSPQMFSSKDQSLNQQGERSGQVKDSSPTNLLYGASYASSTQISSSKDQSKNQQHKRFGLVKDSGHYNPMYGALYASSPLLSPSKDQSQNQQRKRPSPVKDLGHSKHLDGASCSKSPRMSSSKDQTKNQQRKRPSPVKDSSHPNSSDGASCAKSQRMPSSKDQSQNQQGARSGLKEDPHHYNPLDGASHAISHQAYAREDNSHSREQANLIPEYYYPLASVTCTSSSSYDRTTVIENPFIWPTTYQSSQGKSENTVDSSMKEPTKHYKRNKGKKVNSVNSVYHRKLQKRHDKKLYLKGMHGRTATRPQVYIGMCSYEPSEQLKVIFAHSIQSFSSEVSSPDEDSYMGPTRV